MKKINVFYHIFLTKGINEIIKEQLDTINKSGIFKHSTIYVFINDTFGNQHTISNDNMVYIKKLSNNILFFTEHQYEIYTLIKLYELSKKEDAYYLYFHTKGATRITHKDDKNYSYKNVKNWRSIMEHFCIENWQECIKYLEKNDLVGCNYFPKNSLPNIPGHYSGNFWWSKSDYINKLPNPKIYIIDQINRFNAEFWIGEIPHTAICLHPIPEQFNYNRCYFYTNENEYKNNIILNKFTN